MGRRARLRDQLATLHQRRQQYEPAGAAIDAAETTARGYRHECVMSMLEMDGAQQSGSCTIGRHAVALAALFGRSVRVFMSGNDAGHQACGHST